MTSSEPPRPSYPDYVLVNHHLFKNAGSTVDWLLARALGRAYLSHDEAMAAGLTSAEALLAYVIERPSIRAVSRHHLPFAPMSHPARAFFDILLVRHPIDRLRSIYDFMRAGAIDDELSAPARRLGLAGFCRYLLDRLPNYVNSPQVTTLVNAGAYVRPLGDEDARRAIDLVRRAAITGSVEQFDECFVAAEYFLQPAWGPLDLAYIPQNVAAARRSLLDQRLAACRQECGQGLYAHLLRVNELDFELLRAAEAELARRVRLIPDYATRLAAYRERCRRLQAPLADPDGEPSCRLPDQPPPARRRLGLPAAISGRADGLRRRLRQRPWAGQP